MKELVSTMNYEQLKKLATQGEIRNADAELTLDNKKNYLIHVFSTKAQNDVMGDDKSYYT